MIEYDPRIMRTLRKSRVRTEIVKYLHRIYPNVSYPEEIARNVGSNATSVIGALRGIGERYKKASSLIERGIVDMVEIDGKKYYRLSQRGMEIIKHLNVL